MARKKRIESYKVGDRIGDYIVAHVQFQSIADGCILVNINTGETKNHKLYPMKWDADKSGWRVIINDN